MANHSLAALLAAVERWQRGYPDDEPEAVIKRLLNTNVAVIRAAAHQHAEALRAGWRYQTDDAKQALRAAADFLDGAQG